MQYAAAEPNTRGQMIAGNQNWNTQVQGTDVDYPADPRVAGQAEGAFFTPQDVTTASKVVVLGRSSAISCSGRTRIRSAR